MTKFVQQTIFAVALISALVCFTNAQTQISPADSEQPKVVKAVAPEKYPPASLAVHAGGDVLIEIKINSAGDVIAATGISGHPLLRALSVQTARRWKFETAEKKSERKAVLTFSYKIADKKEEAGIFFVPPYKIEFIAQPPTLDY